MPSTKTKISRLAKRGSYEPEVINQILDEGLFCTISYSFQDQPFQIPTGYCRIQDKLYIHGSVGSHFIRAIQTGTPVSIGVTLLDGLVLARSAFHHSMNYRSVIIFSRAEIVEDAKEKMEVLKVFTNKFLHDRWEHIRKPNEKEMKQTAILAFCLDESSAKIRTGGVDDDEADMNWPVWAGVLPLKVKADKPIPDPKIFKDIGFNYDITQYHVG